jgi:hypothetical protein
VNDKPANLLSLFASSSTLICCALPALFVAVGAGASLASLVTVFPFLIVLSKYKVAISLVALSMLVLAGYANYKTHRMPCPLDTELAKTCMRTRAKSRYIYYVSVALFIFASIFTYVVPRFL